MLWLALLLFCLCLIVALASQRVDRVFVAVLIAMLSLSYAGWRWCFVWFICFVCTVCFYFFCLLIFFDSILLVFNLIYFYFIQLIARLITFDKTGLYNDGRRDTYNKHVYATRDKIYFTIFTLLYNFKISRYMRWSIMPSIKKIEHLRDQGCPISYLRATLYSRATWRFTMYGKKKIFFVIVIVPKNCFCYNSILLQLCLKWMPWN